MTATISDRGSGAQPELSWRVLIDPPLGGAENMARDEALAAALTDGQAVLRLYSWDEPTISFGRNEASWVRWEEARRRGELDLAVTRRPTGGRAVLHDAEVTYAVAVPQRAFEGPRRAYGTINRALAMGLRTLGAEVAVVEESAGVTVLPLDAGPCFRSPAVGEVVAHGRKLVGSAQARIGRVLLQHGSIILSGDQAALEPLDPGATPAQPPATLEELVGPVGFEAVCRALVPAFEEALGGAWAASAWSEEELGAVARLRGARYDREDWTFRR